MTITLAVDADVITLDPDLFWADENNWHPVEQSAQRTITGALIISVARRVAGRPITLQPEEDSSAWMTSEDIERLKVWAAEPGQQMQLMLRGVERTVIFRHQDTALEALPVVHYRDVLGVDWYRPTLRFMEI